MLRILIVEDERPISDLIKMTLERSGYRCVCAFDGIAAADMVTQQQFDLILLDVMLPGADGFTLMDYIRPLEIPVIFITAMGDVGHRVQGIQSGADDYIVKPFDLAELIGETENELAFYKEKYRITLHCSWQKGERFAERDLLKTLLLNLIDNGRKAMPQGGVIAVTQTLTDDGFVISVADHDCGMEEKELARITEAFYRVDKSRSRALGGAGLGLAICNEIAAVHGGELTFISTPGEGTTATLTVRGQRT